METKDRHREGYYKEYAERTGKKDRHSADYYKKYRERKKLEKETSSSSVSSSTSITETNKKAKTKKAYYRENIQRDLTEVSQKDMSMVMSVMGQ